MAIDYLRLEETASNNKPSATVESGSKRANANSPLFYPVACLVSALLFTLFLLYNFVVLNIFIRTEFALEQSPSIVNEATISVPSAESLEAINQRIWAGVEKAYKKPVSRIDCSAILAGSKEYIAKAVKRRLFFKEDPKEENLPMDCASIRDRQHFIESPLSPEEAKFPLAYARIVNQDYFFLEAEFATNYHPQNVYCFVVDAKASGEFRQRMHSLATCFANVFLPEDVQFPVDSSGHHMGQAFMSCLRLLARPDNQWRYVFTLQNHDVQLRSNQEMVQILRWLDGASDLDYNFNTEYAQRMIRELNAKFDWGFPALGLFRNATLNTITNTKGKQRRLQLTKGLVQTSLARPFVDFVVHELNLTEFLARLDTREYGADELFFQTLAASDDLNAPGGFTHTCVDRHIIVPYMSRFTLWNHDKCHSGIMRHSICIFGIEDLASNLRDNWLLFANKMMPSADFGAVLCWHQEIRRRTLLDRGLHRLNTSTYQNWPQTIYARNWRNNSGQQIDLEHFNCKRTPTPSQKQR